MKLKLSVLQLQLLFRLLNDYVITRDIHDMHSIEIILQDCIKQFFKRVETSFTSAVMSTRKKVNFKLSRDQILITYIVLSYSMHSDDYAKILSLYMLIDTKLDPVMSKHVYSLIKEIYKEDEKRSIHTARAFGRIPGIKLLD